MLLINTILWMIIITWICYFLHNLKKKVEKGDDSTSKTTKKLMKAFIPYYKIL